MATSHQAGLNPPPSRARSSPLLSVQAPSTTPSAKQDSLEDMVKGSEHGLCSHEQHLKAIHHPII